jgi:hypothetical protein
MKYLIVRERAHFINELEVAVNELIANGWEPLGGIGGDGNYGGYAQAMIKREKPAAPSQEPPCR